MQSWSFGAEHRRGVAQIIERQRGAPSVAARHRGAINVHVRRPGAILRAERHRGTAQTTLRGRGASSVVRHHHGTVNVHVRRRGATLRAKCHRGAAKTTLHRRGASSSAERHRYAGKIHVHRRLVAFRAEHRVAPPKSCADVAQAEWQSTTVVPSPCAHAAITGFSPASLAMVYPPGQYSRRHSRVRTRRSANLRDTPCTGDVSSAVLTTSRVVGEPRRLAPARSWCHVIGQVPSQCGYRRAHRLGSAFAAGRRR